LDARQSLLDARQRHIQRLTRHLETLTTRSDQLIQQRLLAFFGGLALVFVALQAGELPGLTAFILWVIGFSSIVIIHQRVRTMSDRFAAMLAIKHEQVARMTLDWTKLRRNVASTHPEHPFARDIDIVGDYSLHRMLDTTVSRGGSERLLQWLLRPRPDQAFITQQQSRLQELIPRRGFRQGLRLKATLAANSQSKWDGGTLITWLDNHAGTQAVKLPLLLTLGGLALTNAILFVLSSAADLPPLWVGTFIVYVMLSGIQWSRLGDLFTEAMSLQDALKQIRAVFNHLETYPTDKTPHLKEHLVIFHDANRTPSAQLRRITRIVSAVSIQRNPVVWIMLNLVMPWDIFFGYQMGQVRTDLSDKLPQWLDTWYEIEALNAFAEFAHNNPHYTFPQVNADQAGITCQQIGHPLIPHTEKVCNDFALDGLGQVILITGSNMSGKSSFLRTLGVNMVLAYAGCVVNAQHFDLGLFRLFTVIRVSDSVVDGISYFYAEVKRLRALLNALEADDDLPVFFLIDEIFRGTNNRERLIGSQSFIKAMVGGKSLGLISTHDLELVTLGDTIAEVSNYHFREHVTDGRMVFDYTLRSGPSPTTNALKIMAIEGLPVDEEATS
jgi:ABC-type multidrug transport system fused ATPase/permease subunit